MTTEGPEVAVVIPAYGHPSLLLEAVESTLRQRGAPPFRVVLVNDGCRLRETDRVCLDYARSRPDLVTYLHTRNGGLSAARNRGVEAALRMWPSVRALYFLDADNRLAPFALARMYEALEADPEADWIFPDIEMFGSSRDLCDTSGPFSRLQLLAGNYCEAGSMVRRSVFEAGVRYDEQMRLGYEDWEFWLQCVGRGLTGRHRPVAGLWYRKRPESMLANTQRDHEQVIAYVRRKHAGLFSLRRAKELEEREAPRFAVFLADRGEVVETSDVEGAAGVRGWGEFASAVRRWGRAPQRHPVPQTIAVTTGPSWELLRRRALAANVLWLLEEDARGHDLAGLTIEQGPAREVRCALSRSRGPRDEDAGRAAVLAVSAARLCRWLEAPPGDDEPIGLAAPGLRCSVRDLEIHDTRRPGEPGGDAEALLREALRHVRPGGRARPFVRQRGRYFWRPAADAAGVARVAFRASPTPPFRRAPGTRHIGFTLPICEFGGVERIVHNLGREAGRLGWRPHLFVIGSDRLRLLHEFRGTFDSIHILPEAREDDPDWAARAVGLLGAMDVVVDNHTAQLGPALGALRRLGVRVVMHLQIVDLTADGMPAGHPFRGIEYEHGIDRVIVPSRRLRSWLLGRGMPAEKVILVPNAPSFEVPPHQLDAVLAERARRGPGEPIRALFMARFDRQKGMDRLVELVRQSRRRKSAVSWRVVGGRVLVEPGRPGPDLDELRDEIRPPALDAYALGRHLSWADVMILPSRFEGAPLGLLEAQQFGCVPLATRVGAVDEQVDDGRTGFLFDDIPDTTALAAAMLGRLEALRDDRAALARLAGQTAMARRSNTWARSVAGLMACLDEWFPAPAAQEVA